MSNFFYISAIVSGVALAFCMVLRIGHFLSTCMGGNFRSAEQIRRSICLHRIALLLVSVPATAFLGFVSFFALLLSGYERSGSGFFLVAVSVCPMIYALLAFFFNLPGMPARPCALAVYLFQLLLAPVLLLIIPQAMPYRLFALPFILYSILWLWNLHDGIAAENDAELRDRKSREEDEPLPPFRESDSWTSL